MCVPRDGRRHLAIALLLVAACSSSAAPAECPPVDSNIFFSDDFDGMWMHQSEAGGRADSPLRGSRSEPSLVSFRWTDPGRVLGVVDSASDSVLFETIRIWPPMTIRHRHDCLVVCTPGEGGCAEPRDPFAFYFMQGTGEVDPSLLPPLLRNVPLEASYFFILDYFRGADPMRTADGRLLSFHLSSLFYPVRDEDRLRLGSFGLGHTFWRAGEPAPTREDAGSARGMTE